VLGEKSTDEAISKDVIKVLRQFNKQSQLKKAITKILAENMSEKPSKKIEEHFKNLDKDGNGKLDNEELCLLLMDIGMTKTKAKEEATAMIKQCDSDRSGYIEMNEFLTIWQRKMLSINETYIHTVFSVLDTNGDGHIDAQELAKVLDMQNDGDDLKINEIIKEVDTDKDGKINFEEFRAAMLERNEFGGKGAEVGLKLDEEIIHQIEAEYVDIDNDIKDNE